MIHSVHGCTEQADQAQLQGVGRVLGDHIGMYSML